MASVVRRDLGPNAAFGSRGQAVKETLFHTELAAAFRAAGYWIAKWPDQAVSQMMQAGDGKMRFALPKPCDLIGCEPGTGRLLAVEAKLLRARTFRVDERMARQVETLRTLAALGARVALGLNFRFVAKRPPARVNRAFLVGYEDVAELAGPDWRRGAVWDFGVLRHGPARLSLELTRVPGGWILPGDSVPTPAQPPAVAQG